MQRVTRTPRRRPGGRFSFRPQEASAGLLESPQAGSLGPLGVPWAALRRPRRRRFLSRSDLWLPASAPLPERPRSHLEAFASRRLPAIAGASPSTVFPGLLDLEPPLGPTFQAPAACTARNG